MISVNDLRTGLTIEVDGEIYTVVERLHVKPCKGAACVRTKLNNLRSWNYLEQTSRAGEKMARAHIELKEMQFMARTGDDELFMDMECNDQTTLPKDDQGHTPKCLIENTSNGI